MMHSTGVVDPLISCFEHCVMINWESIGWFPGIRKPHPKKKNPRQVLKVICCNIRF